MAGALSGRRDPDAIFPGAFDVEAHLVRKGEHLLRLLAALRERSPAYAEGDITRLVFSRDGNAGDCEANPLRRQARGLGTRLRQKNGELISTETADHIGLAGGIHQHPTDLPQHRISLNVPAEIVDALEVVQVDDEHAEGVGITPGSAKLLAKPLVKITPAVNTGNLVNVDEGENTLELRPAHQPGPLQDLLDGVKIVKSGDPETDLPLERLLQLLFVLTYARPDPIGFVRGEASPGELEEQLDIEVVVRTGERGDNLLQGVRRVKVPVLAKYFQQVDPLRFQFFELLRE